MKRVAAAPRKECAFHSAVSMPASAIAFVATVAMYSGLRGARAFLTFLNAKKRGWEHTRLEYSAKNNRHRPVHPFPRLIREADIEAVLRGKQVWLQHGQVCASQNKDNAKNYNVIASQRFHWYGVRFNRHRSVQNRCDVIKIIVFCARPGCSHLAVKDFRIKPFPLVRCEVLLGAFYTKRLRVPFFAAIPGSVEQAHLCVPTRGRCE